jgi:hypothetical protein
MAVDTVTGDLLDLIADSDDLGHHRAEVERAIWAVAVDNDGHIDPNLVRRILPGWVKPQAVGPTYRAMTLAGDIEPDGWTTNDDTRGRNSGKPLRTYRVRSEQENEVPF